MIPTNTISAGVLGLGAVVAAALGISGVNDLNDPPPAGLRLVALEYKNGDIYQDVRIFGRESIRGEWAAKFTRDGRILCAGGGVSSYNGEPIHMDPSTWVNDDCPDIKTGDVAAATWEWQIGNLTHGISGSLVIP